MRRERGVASIWPDERPLIGVVHLPPLPGSPDWGGSMTAVVERAAGDAAALADAGFDGVILENYSDHPFFARSVPAETVAAMSVAIRAASLELKIPYGVNVLRNDAESALAVAVATSARFIRVNVLTGAMWTDQGLVEGRAAQTLRRRAALSADIAIFADVHVKHASPPAGSSLEDATRDTWSRGGADALVVTGRGTGSRAALDDVRTVRGAAPDATVVIGSGLRTETAREALAVAHGAIVGSDVMDGGRAGGPIDPARARAFVNAVRG